MDDKIQDPEKIVFLKKTIDLANKQVIFTLGNGQSLTVKQKDCSEQNLLRACLHGISQRIGDSCSGLSKAKEYGLAFAGMTDLAEQLTKPEWSSGKSDFGGVADLITAISNLKKKPVEVVQAAVVKASDEQKKTWISNKKIKSEMADIRARRAKQAAKDSEDEIDIDLT